MKGVIEVMKCFYSGKLETRTFIGDFNHIEICLLLEETSYVTISRDSRGVIQ